MPFEIPKEETGTISEIKDLSQSNFEKLIAALGAAPLTSDSSEMAEFVGTQLPSVPADKIVRLLNTLYSLYHVRELSGVDHLRFLEDLMDGIRLSPEIKATPKALSKLQSGLERLMSIPTLNTIAKAVRLQRDGERLYCKSKVLSDIRPVFGVNPADRPLGAVLAHTLKIGYHEGKGHQEFHVVLDSGDLDVLATVIARAQAKDKTLRGLLVDANLRSLDD